MALASGGGADGGGGSRGEGWKNEISGCDKIDLTTEKGTDKKVECDDEKGRKWVVPTEEEVSYLGKALFARNEFNEALDDLLCRSEEDKSFANYKHQKHPQYPQKIKRCQEAYQKYKDVLRIAEERAVTVMVKFQVKKLVLETEVGKADYACKY
ncbi:hypothetical protein OROHE_022902 [Orobanche hederae]